MIPREENRIMGQLTGVFYETAGGNKLYLAHRTKRQIMRAKYAWCIEVSALQKCQAAGITAVGVLWKEGSKRMVHLTHIEDWDGPNSFPLFTHCKQRCLPLKCFRVDPARSEAVIAKAIKLR